MVEPMIQICLWQIGRSEGDIVDKWFGYFVKNIKPEFEEIQKRIQNSENLHLPNIIAQYEDQVYIVSYPVFKACHSYGKKP
jgi:hypothetical protein